MAGGKCLRKFLQLIIIIYVFGVCIGYQIFISQLLSYMMEQILPNADKDFFESYKFRLIVNVPIAGLILLPLSLKRDMSSLAFAGFLSICALFYTLLVLIVETPFYYNEYIDKPGYEIRAFIFDWNILTSFSLIFFAFTCQMQVLPIYSELVRPNYRRIKKVVHRALILDLLFYAFISAAGYFSMFNGTSDIVI